MLLFSNIGDFDIDQLLSIRRSIYDNNIPGEENIDFVFPHDAYHIGINSLQGSGDPYIAFGGIRVIEMGSNSFRFIYDLHRNNEGTGPQVFKDEKYIAAYESAFETISSGNDTGHDIHVRTVGVPSLYVEALWLHNVTNPSLDQFLLIRSVHLLSEQQFYDREKFFNFLRNRARVMRDNTDERRNENDDEVNDTTGPLPA